jgi:PAS domain S-box-containing protein
MADQPQTTRGAEATQATTPQTGPPLTSVEAALRRSDARFRRLVNSNIVGIMVVDFDGRVTEANDALLQLVGYTREDLHSGLLCWQRLTLPKYRQEDDRAREQLQSAGSYGPCEREYLRKDGRRVPVLAGAIVIDESPKCLCLVSDLTRQKQAEERFRQLLESTPDATFLVDAAGKILLVNAQSEGMFGYRREELREQSIEMLIPQSLRQRHQGHRQQFMADPQTRMMGNGLELTALRKDGGEFPVEISLRPLTTEEGPLVFCAVRDITQRKQMERLLGENEAQLLAAQRIQEHLLPGSSPQVPGFEMAGASFPAEFAAGDYFDYLPMFNQTVGVVVGDVSGHGVGPALLMAATHAYLRALAHTGSGLGEMLTIANRILCDHIDDDRFVTLLLAHLDPRSRSLYYVNAGHPTGYVLDAAGGIKARLNSMNLPLGIDAKLEFSASVPITLVPGDLALVLTDGVLEAQSATGELFGIPRALELVYRHRDRSAREIVEMLCAGVRDFGPHGKLYDDVTAVIIKAI